MRRTLAFVAILVIAFGQSLANTARADSILNELLEFADTKLEFSATGTGDQSYLIDLTKVSPNFFSKYAVLDARITYDLAQVANRDCPPYLQLSQSDATGTADSKIARATISSLKAQRSSRLPPPRVSRIRSRWVEGLKG